MLKHVIKANFWTRFTIACSLINCASICSPILPPRLLLNFISLFKNLFKNTSTYLQANKTFDCSWPYGHSSPPRRRHKCLVLTRDQKAVPAFPQRWNLLRTMCINPNHQSQKRGQKLTPLLINLCCSHNLVSNNNNLSQSFMYTVALIKTNQPMLPGLSSFNVTLVPCTASSWWAGADSTDPAHSHRESPLPAATAAWMSTSANKTSSQVSNLIQYKKVVNNSSASPYPP